MVLNKDEAKWIGELMRVLDSMPDNLYIAGGLTVGQHQGNSLGQHFMMLTEKDINKAAIKKV